MKLPGDLGFFVPDAKKTIMAGQVHDKLKDPKNKFASQMCFLYKHICLVKLFQELVAMVKAQADQIQELELKIVDLEDPQNQKQKHK